MPMTNSSRSCALVAPPAGAVLHCFTGSDAELDECLALGLHIRVTGWLCDERRGQLLREQVARIPAGRLMIETDAPIWCRGI